MTDIPITLTALPVPVGIQAINFDQLLVLICRYVAGQISANVSFFLQGSNWPLSDQGIFFNQSTRQFGTWDTGQGKYLPLTNLVIGDLKASLAAGDETAGGWIQLDGRSINSITGINQDQKSALEGLFGVDSNLPDYTFFGALQNLPASGSFSSINVAAISPTSTSVLILPVGATYDQGEMQGIRGALAGVDSSAESLVASTTSVRDVSEQVLGSLNSAAGDAGPKWFVYCGSQ